MEKHLILVLISAISVNSFAVPSTVIGTVVGGGANEAPRMAVIAGAVLGVMLSTPGVVAAISFAKEDNVELNFRIDNRSSRIIYYDRNDWVGWDSDKENNGCTNCKGSILPGQSASASTGSNKKGASIAWNIGFNPDFNIDKITYARVWKQSNKTSRLDIQSGNTPYNIAYTSYATEDSNYKNYLFIANDVPTGVTIAPVSCQNNDKQICNTDVSVYDVIENIPPAAKTYTAEGTNNVEILASSDFTLKSGEAIRVQAGLTSSRYGNKYKAYELLNLSTDDSTLKLRFIGCNDVLCSTKGNTLWEKSSNLSELSKSSIPAGTYKFALQNDGNMVDYDESGNVLGALW